MVVDLNPPRANFLLLCLFKQASIQNAFDYSSFGSILEKENFDFTGKYLLLNVYQGLSYIS